MAKDSGYADIASELDNLSVDGLANKVHDSKPKIVKEEVRLPGGDKQKGKLAFVLHNVLTPEVAIYQHNGYFTYFR